MKIKVKIYSIFCLTVLAIGFMSPMVSLSAQTTEEEQIETLNKQIEDETEKLADLDTKINDLNEQITTLQTQIDDINTQNAELQIQIDQLNTDIENGKTNVDSILVLLQHQSNTNVVSQLLFSGDGSSEDFIKNLSTLNQLMDESITQLFSYVSLLQQQSAAQAELTANLDTLNQSKADLEAQKKELQTQIDESKEVTADVNKQLEELKAVDSTADTVAPSTVDGSTTTAEQKQIMSDAGISESDYQYVDYIVSKESGWDYTATNSSSGAYGLCQSLPGSKMASSGSDWQTNPVTQMKWCDGYATSRYGSWAEAYDFWIANNWW